MISVTDMTTDYFKIIEAVIDSGRKTSPRGEATFELENVHIRLKNPELAMPVGIGRKASMKILAAEAVQWAGGFSDLQQLAGVSRERFRVYSDDGIKLYGAYGPRAKAGLLRAVEKLSDDPESRQAVASIWRHDEAFATNDLPCTTSWGFRIRDGKLNMTTTMRSNDVWTGITYDFPAMTRLQSAIAWALDVPVGQYDHFVSSLHLYERDADAASELKIVSTQPPKQPPMWMLDDDELLGLGFAVPNFPVGRWLFFRDALLPMMYRGESGLPANLAWYAEKLKGVRRYPYLCPTCGYWLPQPELWCEE